ncbi:IS3 family transposase [Actinocrispum wychmicini]|uniref:Transposase InsO family protein n=1 Tax=Actinocrispum wychmicini TaxID=1213861 RepID=A0A4R2J915_9PSEU|nr:IS3 family transposase [Actinocrispum wychmicini]TCO55813.1 transposase InsO family protein [Actinocrispum wychmicini]
MNVYPFIEAENASPTGNVKRSCELLQVSRSAFYEHRNGTSGKRARSDAALTEKIITVHTQSRGTYGAPRIQAELADRGHRHARKRIARLLRESGLAGLAPKRWRTTTVPDPVAVTPPDLIARDFSCTTGNVDTRWCGDITYIHTWEGWLYLATVIDLDSRRVVGWATADHLRTDLVAHALRTAICARRPASGVIFHSDRGCQYTSVQYGRLARANGVRLSVGRTGVCWDNAVAESFFATIKSELLNRQPWPTKSLAHKAIFDWIEGWYNTRRRHSSLGYLSPATFEHHTGVA